MHTAPTPSGALIIGTRISRFAKRTLVAEVGMVWIRSVLAAHRSTAKPPAIIFDIDDTLCDSAEKGIDHMIRLFQMARRNSLRLHVISARPESTRKVVLELLNHLCVGVDSENLHLMTDDEYRKGGHRHNDEFKHTNFKRSRPSTPSSRASATRYGTSPSQNKSGPPCPSSKIRMPSSASTRFSTFLRNAPARKNDSGDGDQK